MTSQEQALVRLARQLSDLEVPYMVIGGVANAVWGEPRATLDIDVTLAAETSECSRLIEGLASEFTPLISDPQGFVEKTRVLPVQSRTGVRVDLIFGLLPFEREAIARAVSVNVQGVEVAFCTAEDLILLKIISTRARSVRCAGNRAPTATAARPRLSGATDPGTGATARPSRDPRELGDLEG